MTNLSQFLLRIALAFAFLYPAYGFWKNPGDWIGYLPSFVQNLGMSQEVLLWGLTGIHVILALWILSGWRIALPSLLAAIFLISVVYFNRSQIDILFRDISLALAALALASSKRT